MTEPNTVKPKKSKRKLFIILGILAVVVVAAILLLQGGDDKKYTEEIAKQQDIITYYSFDGNIQAADTQKVLSTTTMPVKTFHVKEGDMVTEGDLLFELDAKTLTSSIDQAKAALEIAKINYDTTTGVGKNQQLQQAQTNYATAKLSYDNAATNLERLQMLFEEGAIAQVDLEQAQTAYDNASLALQSAQSNLDLLKQNQAQNEKVAKEQVAQAQASLNSLQSQLEDTKVTAEVDGEVVEIYVEENASVVMGTPILDIVDYNSLEVEIKVDEYDLDAIAEGTPAQVYISAMGESVNGSVSKINREATLVNGVSYFPTKVSIEYQDFLRIGMSVEVKVQNQNVPGATTISMKALQFDNENKPFVYYRDTDGKVKEKAVTVGANDGNVIQIVEGIQPGDTVLLPVTMTYVSPMGMMVEE